MIFVDVGAHDGQTLEEAIRYEFDRLYAFEPMPLQFTTLTERYANDPRVQLFNYGLSDMTETRNVYGSNADMEASIYPDKHDVDASYVTSCEFMAAEDFFHALPETAFVKMNCEGAEVPILNNLIDTGEIWMIESLLVDFDVRRIPGMETQEADLLDRFKKIGFDRYIHCEDAVPCGRALRIEGRYRYTRQDEIMCWLKSHGIATV